MYFFICHASVPAVVCITAVGHVIWRGVQEVYYRNSQTKSHITDKIVIESSEGEFTFRIHPSKHALRETQGDLAILVRQAYSGDFSKLTDSNQIFRDVFVCIHYHLCKISTQIIECIIIAPYDFLQKIPPYDLEKSYDTIVNLSRNWFSIIVLLLANDLRVRNLSI